MHMDPLMPQLVATIAIILAIGLAMRALEQPHVVAYLVAGIALGPHGVGLVSDQALIGRVGEIGVVLLLFFVGMEISLPEMTKNWRVPVLGTLFQVAASVGVTVAIGTWQSWPLARSVLLGFVTSLSSTAVVVSLLDAWKQTHEPTGRDVIGILLAQDLVVVLMLITLGLLSGERPSGALVARQMFGGVLLLLLLVALTRGWISRLPFGRLLRHDQQLQVFSAFLVCFSFALLTGLLGLSTALGAFVAGITVGATRETEWVHQSLYPFQVLLVSLFFVSVGMAIDLEFILRHAMTVGLLLLAVMLINNTINALILRVLGRTWRDSLYGGALLAQIGEFSFVIAAVGQQRGLIESFAYQASVAVIALSLAISPLWIGLFRRIQARGGAPFDPPSDPPTQPAPHDDS